MGSNVNPGLFQRFFRMVSSKVTGASGYIGEIAHSVVELIINPAEFAFGYILDNYIEGNVKGKIKTISLGCYNIQNLKLRPDIFIDYQLPFIVENSYVGEIELSISQKYLHLKDLFLNLKINWSNLYSQQPEFQNVYSYKSMFPEKDNSLFFRIILSTIGQLNLLIENVHIRLEYETESGRHMTFGIIIKRVELGMMKGEEVNINNKVNICDFSIYLDANHPSIMGYDANSFIDVMRTSMKEEHQFIINKFDINGKFTLIGIQSLNKLELDIDSIELYLTRAQYELLKMVQNEYKFNFCSFNKFKLRKSYSHYNWPEKYPIENDPDSNKDYWRFVNKVSLYKAKNIQISDAINFLKNRRKHYYEIRQSQIDPRNIDSINFINYLHDMYPSNVVYLMQYYADYSYKFEKIRKEEQNLNEQQKREIQERYKNSELSKCAVLLNLKDLHLNLFDINKSKISTIGFKEFKSSIKIKSDKYKVQASFSNLICKDQLHGLNIIKMPEHEVKKFVQFEFYKNIEEFTGKLNLTIVSPIIYCYPQFIKSMIDFFDSASLNLKEVEESPNDADETPAELSDKQIEFIKYYHSRINFQINIYAPILIAPINPQFELIFGSIKINSCDLTCINAKERYDEEIESNYDHFKLDISDFKIKMGDEYIFNPLRTTVYLHKGFVMFSNQYPMFRISSNDVREISIRITRDQYLALVSFIDLFKFHSSTTKQSDNSTNQKTSQEVAFSSRYEVKFSRFIVILKNIDEDRFEINNLALKLLMMKQVTDFDVFMESLSFKANEGSLIDINHPLKVNYSEKTLRAKLHQPFINFDFIWVMKLKSFFKIEHLNKETVLQEGINADFPEDEHGDDLFSSSAIILNQSAQMIQSLDISKSNEIKKEKTELKGQIEVSNPIIQFTLEGIADPVQLVVSLDDFRLDFAGDGMKFCLVNVCLCVDKRIMIEPITVTFLVNDQGMNLIIDEVHANIHENDLSLILDTVSYLMGQLSFAQSTNPESKSSSSFKTNIIIKNMYAKLFDCKIPKYSLNVTDLEICIGNDIMIKLPKTHIMEGEQVIMNLDKEILIPIELNEVIYMAMKVPTDIYINASKQFAKWIMKFVVPTKPILKYEINTSESNPFKLTIDFIRPKVTLSFDSSTNTAMCEEFNLMVNNTSEVKLCFKNALVNDGKLEMAKIEEFELEIKDNVLRINSGSVLYSDCQFEEYMQLINEIIEVFATFEEVEVISNKPSQMPAIQFNIILSKAKVNLYSRDKKTSICADFEQLSFKTEANPHIHMISADSIVLSQNSKFATFSKFKSPLVFETKDIDDINYIPFTGVTLKLHADEGHLIYKWSQMLSLCKIISSFIPHTTTISLSTNEKESYFTFMMEISLDNISADLHNISEKVGCLDVQSFLLTINDSIIIQMMETNIYLPDSSKEVLTIHEGMTLTISDHLVSIIFSDISAYLDYKCFSELLRIVAEMPFIFYQYMPPGPQSDESMEVKLDFSKAKVFLPVQVQTESSIVISFKSMLLIFFNGTNFKINAFRMNFESTAVNETPIEIIHSTDIDFSSKTENDITSNYFQTFNILNVTITPVILQSLQCVIKNIIDVIKTIPFDSTETEKGKNYSRFIKKNDTSITIKWLNITNNPILFFTLIIPSFDFSTRPNDNSSTFKFKFNSLQFLNPETNLYDLLIEMFDIDLSYRNIEDVSCFKITKNTKLSLNFSTIALKTLMNYIKMINNIISHSDVSEYKSPILKIVNYLGEDIEIKMREESVLIPKQKICSYNYKEHQNDKIVFNDIEFIVNKVTKPIIRGGNGFVVYIKNDKEDVKLVFSSFIKINNLTNYPMEFETNYIDWEIKSYSISQNSIFNYPYDYPIMKNIRLIVGLKNNIEFKSSLMILSEIKEKTFICPCNYGDSSVYLLISTSINESNCIYQLNINYPMYIQNMLPEQANIVIQNKESPVCLNSKAKSNYITCNPDDSIPFLYMYLDSKPIKPPSRVAISEYNNKAPIPLYYTDKDFLNAFIRKDIDPATNQTRIQVFVPVVISNDTCYTLRLESDPYKIDIPAKTRKIWSTEHNKFNLMHKKMNNFVVDAFDKNNIITTSLPVENDFNIPIIIKKSYSSFGVLINIVNKFVVTNKLNMKIYFAPFDRNPKPSMPFGFPISLNPGESVEDIISSWKIGDTPEIHKFSLLTFESPKEKLTIELNNDAGSIIYFINTPNGRVFLKLKQKSKKHVVHVTVSKATLSSAPYIVSNQLNVPIKYFLEHHIGENNTVIAEPETSTILAYHSQELPRITSFKFVIGEELICTWDPKCEDVVRYLNPLINVKIIREIASNKKTITFSDKPIPIPKVPALRLSFNLKKIEVSLIDWQYREIALVSFNLIKAKLETNEITTSMGFSVHSFQIDDLHPKTTASVACLCDSYNSNDAISCKIEMKANEPLFTYFNNIFLSISPIYAFIDKKFLVDLISYFTYQVKSVRSPSVDQFELSTPAFVRYLKLDSLNLNISLLSDNRELFYESSYLKNVMFNIPLTHLSKKGIKIYSLNFNDCLTKIQGHLMKGMFSDILTLLGKVFDIPAQIMKNKKRKDIVQKVQDHNTGTQARLARVFVDHQIVPVESLVMYQNIIHLMNYKKPTYKETIQYSFTDSISNNLICITNTLLVAIDKISNEIIKIIEISKIDAESIKVNDNNMEFVHKSDKASDLQCQFSISNKTYAQRAKEILLMRNFIVNFTQ